jgi:hypothetical protein
MGCDPVGFGWPAAASCRYELLGESGGSGTTVTSNASANVKGSYTTIGTANFAYDGFWLHITNTQGGTAYRYMVDLAVNNGGSDQIIVADMYYDGSIGGAYYTSVGALPSFIPVVVPKSATLKARCQASTGSGTVAVAVQGVQGDGRLIRPFRGLVNDTPFTNSDPTNSVTSSGTSVGSWGQIIASTSLRYSAIYFATSLAGITAAAPIGHRIDIGWGAAASERVLFSIVSASYSAPPVYSGGALGPYPCDLPSGTRLAVRVQSSYASSTLYPILYGLAA